MTKEMSDWNLSAVLAGTSLRGEKKQEEEQESEKQEPNWTR